MKSAEANGDLLKNGHSIEELIELFSDPLEQHDIYVNSGLVYPDFKILVDILTKYNKKEKSIEKN